MLLFKIDKETKKFTGFYDDKIHNVKTDDVEYFEITKNKHSELIENQSEGGEIYWNGEELVSIFKPPVPEGIVKPVFDYHSLEWEETATEEEKEVHQKELEDKEYKKQLPLTVFDMDNRLYTTQEMVDMLLFEMMSVQTFAMKTMTTEKQEEYMTTQAFYYYDRIIQKEKREGLQSAINYYSLVVSKFPQYKDDIDFLLIENDKEYIIGA